MADRRDAVLAFARIACALEGQVGGYDAVVKFTIGRVEVYPNAPSVIAEKVVFRVDLRHPDNDALENCGAKLKLLCAQQASPCTASVTELVSASSNGFDPDLQRRIGAAAKRRHVPAMKMLSFAGHDARQMARLCPSAMIFIPCRNGISHDESEWAEPEHVKAGGQLLLDVLMDTIS
jgi:N-carbamoyl-L-amino-acid hydrolase